MGFFTFGRVVKVRLSLRLRLQLQLGKDKVQGRVKVKCSMRKHNAYKSCESFTNCHFGVLLSQ